MTYEGVLEVDGWMKIETTEVSQCLLSELNNDIYCGFNLSIFMNYWEMLTQIYIFVF